jgi:hypothetical protein
MDMGDKEIQAFMSLVNERRTHQTGDYPNRSERLLGADRRLTLMLYEGTQPDLARRSGLQRANISKHIVRAAFAN